MAFDATDNVYGQLFSLRPDLVRDYALFLRENHLSLFEDRLFTSEGKSLTSLFSDTTIQGCSGSIDELDSSKNQEREKGVISGWSSLERESHGHARIVLTDESGVMMVWRVRSRTAS